MTAVAATALDPALPKLWARVTAWGTGTKPAEKVCGQTVSAVPSPQRTTLRHDGAHEALSLCNPLIVAGLLAFRTDKSAALAISFASPQPRKHCMLARASVSASLHQRLLQ